jgi:hypothetical protein
MFSLAMTLMREIVENPVDPVTNFEAVLVGFDMDVAGPGLDGLGDDVVDQLDDGRIAGVVEKIGGVLQFADDGAFALFQVLDQLLGRVLAHIVGNVDDRQDRIAGGQNDLILDQSQDAGQIVELLEVGRVVHGDDVAQISRRHRCRACSGARRFRWGAAPPGLDHQRHHVVLLQKLDRHEAGERKVDVVQGKFGPEGDVIELGQGLQDLVF